MSDVLPGTDRTLLVGVAPRDGLELHYVDEGYGEPLLMLHGNPTWSFYYRRLVAAFGADHRCVVPDHIGCGRSSKPAPSRYGYRLADRVADLDRLIGHLTQDAPDDFRRITLVLHDWGAMIGAAWAVRNPHRIARLVVMNSAGFPMPEGARLSWWLRTARLPLLGTLLVRGLGLFSRVANRICAGRDPLPREVAAAYLAPYDSWANRVAVHRFVLDLPLRPGHPSWALVRDTAAQLDRLAEVPLLLCWGMRDTVLDDRWLAEWIRRFPRAEVHRFEDAGHYVLEGAADGIVDRMRDFLARTAQVEAG